MKIRFIDPPVANATTHQHAGIATDCVGGNVTIHTNTVGDNVSHTDAYVGFAAYAMATGARGPRTNLYYGNQGWMLQALAGKPVEIYEEAIGPLREAIEAVGQAPIRQALNHCLQVLATDVGRAASDYDIDGAVEAIMAAIVAHK